MEFQLCSEYLIQLHSYACHHEPHTYSTYSYNCNDTISADVWGDLSACNWVKSGKHRYCWSYRQFSTTYSN